MGLRAPGYNSPPMILPEKDSELSGLGDKAETGHRAGQLYIRVGAAG